MKKNETEELLEFPDQKIVEVPMEREVKKSFLDYAMSVIVSRALPDAKDGLKPVHRRILYSMFEDGLTVDKPYRKSATTVGNVLGSYHPHGDSSVYDAMVRLAQPFSMRYPLIDGHGNFGSVDGDPAAAYRYTEARMAKISDLMLADIKKEVVDWDPNFDNKLKEPHVLPSRFPNLLVNGSVGIAVGMATNIPPHNLTEVIDGTVYLMDHPDATIPELMEFIKGPDFPTGATIYGTAGITETYMTGRGRITVRSKAHVDEEKHQIIITEIPYQVNKVNLVQAMADCVKDKRIEGITNINDETSMEGMRIVVDFRKDANGYIILNQLYKFTQLQDTFAAVMLALVNGEPKVLNLKQILEVYIAHQIDVITRRTQFELKRALHDAHINEGYRIAIDNIDEVIRIIRASGSVQEAKEALMRAFTADDVDNLIGEGGKEGLSDMQAQAIVEMPLGRLAGMERKKIEETLAGLMDQIRKIEEILHDESKIRDIIKNDLNDVKAKFGDARRTGLEAVENELLAEDLIEKHTCLITMTHDGYIKRQNSAEYFAQNRGGMGVKGMGTKETDDVEKMFGVYSHSSLLLFTNLGKVHVKKAYTIPEVKSNTGKGTHINNIVDLQTGETVTALVSINGWKDGSYLTMVTKNGTVKRTALSEFEYQRKGGKIAISLDEGDELTFVLNTKADDEIIIATKEGCATRFPVSEVREMGRTARGVIGIRPEEGDYVTSAALVEPEKDLLTVTEYGYGKRTSYEDFRSAHRGGKGVIVHGINEKTGKLCGIASVAESADVMLMSSEPKIIRTPASGISYYSRTASGVIVMRTDRDKGVVVTDFTVIPSEEEINKMIAAAEEASANDDGTETDEMLPTDTGTGEASAPEDDGSDETGEENE